MQKIILITGATSGIGFQTAKLLTEQGNVVYGAGRNADKLEILNSIGVKSIKMDLTDDISIQAAISKIIKESGKIDVLVNNAGYGSFGAIEEVPISEAQQQFDVNLFGLARVTQLVLPYMRKQKSGKIINTSSVAGRIPTYLGGWYNATKYALEGFTDDLRMEMREFNVKVVLIEPGVIKTPWSEIAVKKLIASSKDNPYEDQGYKAASNLSKQYSSKFASNPEIVAKTITKVVNKKSPRTRYLIGFGAKPLVFLHTILPNKWFDTIMIKFS